MRKKFFGYYVTPEKYILSSENSDVKKILNAGEPFWIGPLKYEVEKSGNGLVVKSTLNEREKYAMPDSRYVMMATTEFTALKGLFRPFKPADEESELVKVLRTWDFVPQCLKTVDFLFELLIPSDWVDGCPNYSGEDKNFYKYEIFTDSTDYSDIRVINPSCATCKKKRKEGCAGMKKVYRAFYNGSYYVLLRKNVETGKRYIQEMAVTKSAEMGKVTLLLNELKKGE